MRQGRAASLIGLALVLGAAGYFLARSRSKAAAARPPARDYSGRSGFPGGATQARGLAADVARDATRWLARPGTEVLPTARVRAFTQPAA